MCVFFKECVFPLALRNKSFEFIFWWVVGRRFYGILRKIYLIITVEISCIL